MSYNLTPGNDRNWELVWLDNFTFFDDTKWAKSHNVSHDEKTPELYLNENVRIEGDSLVIAVNNDSTLQQPDGKLYYYTSGRMRTTPAHDVRFGYIEARVKAPYRENYAWSSAFWTFRREDIPPAINAGEIDIFELLCGRFPSNTITTNIHTCYTDEETYPIQETDPCQKIESFQASALSNFSYTDWNTYAIEWNSDRIIWFVNGTPIRILRNADFDGDGNSIVDVVRLIFNIGFHGNTLPPLSPRFEEYMKVDWIRVYRLKSHCEEAVHEIYNFDNFNYGLKKSITLSGATIVPNGKDISLRATDYIELKPGFELPLNAKLYLDINPCD